MADVVGDLPISDDVRLALVSQSGPLQPIMQCVLAYEQGDWDAVSQLAESLGVNSAVVPQLYLDAIPADLRETVGTAVE